MRATNRVAPRIAGAFAAFALLACSLGAALGSPQVTTGDVEVPPPPVATLGAAVAPEVTATAAVVHTALPASPPGGGKLVYDVTCEDTAPERRAPYGDSYDINRLSRPFQQDMTYVPDLDIVTYTVSSDATWWYVSLDLVGGNPNNGLGINYGVELDLDHDGFGDYLILAHPPYNSSWETTPVQVFRDNNHNTGGLSGEKSDAPLTADGYETLIFNGGAGDADPDLAWVRVVSGAQGTVEFAFKKSMAGVVFMLGTFADAGLRDPKQLDYVDRFTLADAGSPVRDNKYYPLRELYLVDNVCREAFGFSATGYEPQLCPRAEPQPTHKPRVPTVVGPCQPPPGGCGMHFMWIGEPECVCIEVPY